MYKGNDSIATCNGQIEVMDVGVKDSNVLSFCSVDPLSTAAELMNFDTYAGWCTSPPLDMASPSFVMSPLNGASTTFSPFDGLNIAPQYSSEDVVDISGGSLHARHRVVFHNVDDQMPFASDSVFEFDLIKDENSCQHNHVGESGERTIPWHPKHSSLAEKMLSALNLLKEDAGEGILLQLWVPVKNGSQYVLSTSEQPYLLDQTLSGYREVSRLFTFSAESKPGSFLGLPGRVFVSKIPEWTSNLMYYNKAEYLRVQYAAEHKVQGSIALPVFELDSIGGSCCAVLELVTLKEKPNFDSEIENVHRVLQAVNLRTRTPPKLRCQSLSKSHRAALSEIADVLRAACHAHQLPLALTWIPCSYTEDSVDGVLKLFPRGCSRAVRGKSVLCIENTACYVNDKTIKGFVHACAENYLEEGSGIVGKALQSNHPFFYPDVKEYHINEYSLVHHARKFGLTAAVAIRLRSMHTGNDDYVLEFFLPLNMTGSAEQQHLLNSLSTTMQRLCRSLRTVSEAESVAMENSEVKSQVGVKPAAKLSSNPEWTAPVTNDLPCRQGIPGSKKQIGKKRNTAEKHVGLNVLRRYFSGSLKDAAKSIGVCPATLKRICRRHGITRWPSRKINKVNRSLKKLQSVLHSVQGVKEGLNLEELVSIRDCDDKNGAVKMKESGDCNIIKSPVTSNVKRMLPCAGKNSLLRGSNDHETSSGMTESSNGSDSSSRSFLIYDKSCEDGSRIVVKACHGEDTVRFRFDPGSGCGKLYDEIGRRFKLESGQFQLKYIDDEDEWVLLVSDSDLEECLNVLQSQGTRIAKFMVRTTK